MTIAICVQQNGDISKTSAEFNIVLAVEEVEEMEVDEGEEA